MIGCKTKNDVDLNPLRHRVYFTLAVSLAVSTLAIFSLIGCGTLHTLTFSPEAQAPLGHGDLPVLVGVAGVEEGSDADLVLVQVDGRQLGLAQIQVAVGVQLRKHPADGVLAAGSEAPVQG